MNNYLSTGPLKKNPGCYKFVNANVETLHNSGQAQWDFGILASKIMQEELSSFLSCVAVNDQIASIVFEETEGHPKITFFETDQDLSNALDYQAFWHYTKGFYFSHVWQDLNMELFYQLETPTTIKQVKVITYSRPSYEEWVKQPSWVKHTDSNSREVYNQLPKTHRTHKYQLWNFVTAKAAADYLNKINQEKHNILKSDGSASFVTSVTIDRDALHYLDRFFNRVSAEERKFANSPKQKRRSRSKTR